MKKLIATFLFPILICFQGQSQKHVTISLNANAGQKPISPYIFGKNNSLSDNKNSPLSAAQWQKIRDLGINFFRENGGNNASKYNWRRKLSSHPDWYNNVYPHDWDYAAKSLQANIPSAQGMWAFQLIGKAAKSTAYNFNDLAYNQSRWWSGVSQNLAGGGVVNPAGGAKAKVEGNPNLYLENWTADSTTGILNHWFGQGGLGLDSAKIKYWSMDNEPEIWEGTHDDVWPVQPDAETFMQKYFASAKMARAAFPGIKLLGPVAANEWQWYNYKGGKVAYKGNSYPWLEYFILRCAEEQQQTGIRLLDVLDVHFYPGDNIPADILQLHRIFFDSTYNYPLANGVKTSGPGDWDPSLTKEYIFKRCNDWLVKYIGPDHGVKLAVTESGINEINPNVTAVWYASTLGEFQKQGVEVFTPWSWLKGMNEVIHLFSRYGNAFHIDGTSSDEQYLSAYPTINAKKDSIILFLVNRHLTESRIADLNLTDFPVKDGTYTLYRLANLPNSETFISHTSNALTKTSVQILNNAPSILLPPLSITALVLKKEDFTPGKFGYLVADAEAENGVLTGVNVTSATAGYSGNGYVTGFDNPGDKVTVSMNVPEDGFYKLLIRYLGKNGDKYQDLLINNSAKASIFFPACDTFMYAEAGSYILSKGINTFTISKNWGWTDIDKFEIYPATKNVYDISPNLVDAQANDSAKALYDFLLVQFGNRIISGQTHDYYDELKSIAGFSPMIRNGELMNYTQGYPYKWDIDHHTFGIVDDGSVDALINWYKSTGRKGIIAYQWHWCSPIGGSAGTNTFYTQYTTFDITKAVTPGTLEDSLILRDIDDIAVQLKKFQDAGIPILWRPLHEAGGGWFWWGAKGPAACKKLYSILFDRLANYHQLHNLIWVWSTPETAWYPGNDSVDIIGYDSYPGNFNYGNQKSAFDVVYKLTGGKKLIAMSENGPIPDPDACLNGDAPWSYFMSWGKLVTQQNSTAHIQQVFANSNVLKLESTNAKTNKEWRSSLYPEDWKRGFKDSNGRYLHDFSYAGYHGGETDIPTVTRNVVDVTQAPYNADNTGVTDVTSSIQKALDDLGRAGGGVVYLPVGTYRIRAPDTAIYALRMSYDSTVLRGAGPDSTFLFHDHTSMRNKDIILMTGQSASWFDPAAAGTNISIDLPEPTRIIPVVSVSGFHAGDQIVVTSTATAAFIDEHNMTGKWTAAAIKGLAFLRRIDTVDASNNLLVIDAPTRYFLKARDQARVYHAKKQLTESGIENLSIGNTENPNSGWAENDYSINGTGAYEVHASHAIELRYAVNCWIKNVHSYKPAVNTDEVHILSNGLLLDQCRFITVDSCFFRNSQYEGEGGNGYLYTLESNDCLIKNSRANHGRHNYSFKYPYSNGNVILRCIADTSEYASDFYMFLSMANLFDEFTVNGDYLESVYSPYGVTAIHGYTSTQSVFYNTFGQSYHPGKTYIIDSRQFGNGYIIGTSGPAFTAVVDPVEGITNGFYFNTRPTDFTEGIGDGQDLVPASLYLDQFDRRKKGLSGILKYTVHVVVKDKATNLALRNSSVKLYGVTKTTDSSGTVSFTNVLEIAVLSIDNQLYVPLEKMQFAIQSDTTLYFYLTEKSFQVTFKVINSLNQKPISGTSVSFFNTVVSTNSSGEAVFTATGGSFNYVITKAYFQNETGILNISSDSIINISMIQIQADVKFRLNDGSTPVNNAYVKINSDSLLTNSLGIVLFMQFSLLASYHYVITKNGYMTIEDDFYLKDDTTLNIAMEKADFIPNVHPNDNEILIWPNPLVDILNCSFPSGNNENIIRITDIVGNVIYMHKANSRLIQIDVKNFRPGVYVVQATYNGIQTARMFIKK